LSLALRRRYGPATVLTALDDSMEGAARDAMERRLHHG